MKRLVITVLILLVPVVAFAEKVTLRQAVEEALKNNPMIQASRFQTEATEMKAKETLRNYFPRLTIEERFMRTDNPTYAFMAKLNQERFTLQDFQIQRLNSPDAQNDFQTSITLEQPVFVPRLIYGIKASKKASESAMIEHKRNKETIIKETIKAYLNVITAKAYLKAANKALEDTKENLRIASLMYEKGLGLLSDKLRASAAVKKAEAMVVEAEKNLNLARRALGIMMGRDEVVDTSDDWPELTVEDLEIYRKLYLQRPDLEALRKKAEAAEAALKVEKSSFWPEVGVGGSYQFNDHNNPFGTEGQSYMVMAFLRWNLFDPTLGPRKQKAEAELRAVKKAIEAQTQRAGLELERAYLDVRAKEKALALAKAELASAEEALRLVRLRYKSGLSPVVDLLNTETVVEAARAKVIQAENDYRLAIIDLYYQAGILLGKVKEF
ncbi:MAG: TolC family protein [Nitrospirae bacterium]|nr:MAG: TolC family protein [Nitrospirota bacterium]